MNAYASELLTPGTSADVTLTAAKLDGSGTARSVKAILRARSNPVIYTFDGGSPTATNSLQIAVDTEIEITGYDNLKNLKVRATSSTSNLYVVYFR